MRSKSAGSSPPSLLPGAVGGSGTSSGRGRGGKVARARRALPWSPGCDGPGRRCPRSGGSG
eukprot:841497-Alexandrium_andersonii.AAC.1